MDLIERAKEAYEDNLSKQEAERLERFEEEDRINSERLRYFLQEKLGVDPSVVIIQNRVWKLGNMIFSVRLEDCPCGDFFLSVRPAWDWSNVPKGMLDKVSLPLKSQRIEDLESLGGFIEDLEEIQSLDASLYIRKRPAAEKRRNMFEFLPEQGLNSTERPFRIVPGTATVIGERDDLIPVVLVEYVNVEKKEDETLRKIT